MVPLPPPPFYPSKDTGAFVSRERKKILQRIAAFMQIEKTRKWQIIPQKSRRELPLSCTAAPVPQEAARRSHSMWAHKGLPGAGWAQGSTEPSSSPSHARPRSHFKAVV